MNRSNITVDVASRPRLHCGTRHRGRSIFATFTVVIMPSAAEPRAFPAWHKQIKWNHKKSNFACCDSCLSSARRAFEFFVSLSVSVLNMYSLGRNPWRKLFLGFGQRPRSVQRTKIKTKKKKIQEGVGLAEAEGKNGDRRADVYYLFTYFVQLPKVRGLI